MSTELKQEVQPINWYLYSGYRASLIETRRDAELTKLDKYLSARVSWADDPEVERAELERVMNNPDLLRRIYGD